VQDDLRVLRIVLVPAIAKGLTCSRERDRGHKPKLKAGLEESIGKWPMIVAGGLKADNYRPADIAKPIDETIMLDSIVQNNKPAVVAYSGRLDWYVVAPM
jgi:hypothetical protein